MTSTLASEPALQIFTDKHLSCSGEVFLFFFPPHVKQSHSQCEEEQHVWSAALSAAVQPRWEVCSERSSRAIRAAERSSRNPNSVSGTFLWVQSKRDRLRSGLPKASTYTGGSTHGRLTSCLPFTYRYPWNHSHWPIPTLCNPKP